MSFSKDDLRRSLFKAGIELLNNDENEPMFKEVKKISDIIASYLQDNSYKNPGVDYLFLYTLQRIIHDMDSQLIDEVEKQIKNLRSKKTDDGKQSYN